MRKFTHCIVTLIFGFCFSEEYFQQDVSYDIEVTLNDTDYTLSAYEKIRYTNNSRETKEYKYIYHLRNMIM